MTFDVPAGYFDNLADTVLQRVKYEDKQARRQNIIMRIAIPAAASLIVAAGMWGFIMGSDTNSPSAEAQNSYIDQYTQNLESGINDNTVIDYITEMGAQDTNSDAENMIDLAYEYYPAPAIIDHEIN